MTTEPSAHQAQVMDASVARSTAGDMSAVVRVLFGVGEPQQVSLVADSAPAPQEPRPTLPVATPEPEGRRQHTIPLSAPSPILHSPDRPLEAEEAPAPTSASLPFSDIPVADSLPGPATHSATDPAPGTLRRPGGPSLELLEELAFLDE